MIRFTTPTIVLRLPIDITNTRVIVSFKQGLLQVNKEIKKSDMKLDDSKNTVIYVHFSQAETGALSNKTCDVQVNWIYSTGERDASYMGKVDVSDNLLEKEITYE